LNTQGIVVAVTVLQEDVDTGEDRRSGFESY
jgi:hypothetical protein